MTPSLARSAGVRIIEVALVCMVGYQLRQVAWDMGFAPVHLMHAFGPTTGEPASLPADVVDALELVRALPQPVQTLRLSPALASDGLLRQRSSEALYPIRISVDAPLVLARIGEDAVAGCDLIVRRTLLELRECTR